MTNLQKAKATVQTSKSQLARWQDLYKKMQKILLHIREMKDKITNK